ncbi:MAG: hypothetical protein MJ014_02415 [Methanocorpusculum sp.]|nr:hypothetical protein [Methanocorpusculum sp.]
MCQEIKITGTNTDSDTTTSSSPAPTSTQAASVLTELALLTTTVQSDNTRTYI